MPVATNNLVHKGNNRYLHPVPSSNKSSWQSNVMIFYLKPLSPFYCINQEYAFPNSYYTYTTCIVLSLPLYHNSNNYYYTLFSLTKHKHSPYQPSDLSAWTAMTEVAC